MKIIEHMDTEIWESRGGGVGPTLFGVMFMGGGLMMLAVSMGLIPVEGDNMPPAAIIPLSLMFLVPGLIAILGHMGLKIDRRSGTVLKWYGLMIPMIRKECPLSAFGRVNLTKELRQQGKTSVTVYAVSIDSKEDVSPIEIDAPRDYNESRRLAEQMAKFLQLPIMDNSTGKEIIRELDQLDETIKQKVERKGETVIDITPPPMMKSNATIEYGVLKAVIPPRGINPLAFLALIPMALFDLFVFFQVILPAIHDGVWPIVGLTVFFFIIVPVIVVLIKFSPDARTTYHVEASRDKLRVEVKKTFGKKTYEIPAHELEELELSESLLPTNVASQMGGDEDKAQGTVNFITKFLSGPEITARSDRTSISFGRGLEREELEYIHSAIKKIMTE